MAIDVELVRESFARIRPKIDELMETFFATLFERHPDIAQLFDGVNMKQQRSMMANALVFVVENLDAMEIASGTLEEMGHRHIDYGARPEHYPAMGECLLHALATVTGKKWNNKLESQWTEIYATISSFMLKGAERATEASVTT